MKGSTHTEGTVAVHAIALAEEIRQTGRRSPQELEPLIVQAEELAHDTSDPFTRGVSVRAAGSAHQMLNNFTAALERYDSALSSFNEAGDQAQIGRTLLAKVGPLAYLGKLDELFACAKDARKLFEDQGDEASLARLNVNLGNAYTRQDYLHEALVCYDQAFPMLEQLGDHEALIAASMNAAVVLTSLHRFDDAMGRYDRAAAIARDLGMHLLDLQCQYNKTYLDYLRGNSGSALDGLRTLRVEFERQSDDQHVCLCWLSEAEVLLEVGELTEAVQSARTARAQAEKLALNYEVGKSFLFEAIALLRSGEEDQARSLLTLAMERFQAEGNNVWTSVSLLQTALFPAEGGLGQALKHATAARTILKERRLQHWLALADVVIGRLQRATGDRECAIDSFRSAVALSEDSDSRWMQFHAYHELGRTLSDKNQTEGIPFLEKAESQLNNLWNKVGSDDLKMAFLSDRENVYTHLVSSVASTDSTRAFHFSERSRSRVLIERLMHEENQVVSGDIVSQLSPDETVVEYFISGDDLFIFVATSDGLKCVRRPGTIPFILNEWSHMERHLTSCSVTWERLKRIAGQLERTASIHLKQLHNYLLEPVQDHLRRKLIVVPHGFLHGIPFQALHDGDAYLSDKHRVVYSPSASLYVTPVERKTNGNPLFIGFSVTSDEGIVEEVERSADLVSNSEVLINPSVEELSTGLEQRRPLLHIAGHAGVDPIQGSLSWIETPDGRLTSRDLIQTKFQADTIVVTGCHTARRTLSAGDEWLGLMRAFYLSGASTIISAHWAIRDDSARLFSKTFYEHYDLSNTGVAVQAATGRIREEFPHPYFWGGFGTFVRKGGGDS
jgi:tetratricopeptide (TPR) repeat protein